MKNALKHIFLMAGLLSAVAEAAPSLFFTTNDLPVLREQVRHGEASRIWKDVLARANQFSDPDSNYFIPSAHPEEKVEWMLGNQWPKLSGRILAIQAEALGPAFWLTGELRHGGRGKALLVAYAERFSRFGATMQETDSLGHGESMRGLAEAYDFFGSLLSPEERSAVLAVCREYVETQLAEAEAPAWYNPYSNWQSVTISGAGLLALAIQDDFPDEAPGWIARSTKLIQAYLDASFGPDGDYAEHGYIEYAMANLVLFADALARQDGSELFSHPHVRHSVEWLVQDMLPGTTAIEPRKDTGWPKKGGYKMAMPWALRMAKVNNDGLARWLWDQVATDTNDFPCVQCNHSDTEGLSFFRILWVNDVASTSPEQADLPMSGFFRRRGLSVWRTGWSTNDAFFSIEAGKAYPVTHEQSDVGHFNIYAFGQFWAADPGYGNQKKPGDRSQGSSHSIVQIDGKSQALVGSGNVVGGESRNYEETTDSCYVLCDATDAYNFYETRKADSFETERHTGNLAVGVEHALRHALYVKPSAGASAYLILCDDIQKDSKVRNYSWQMIADPNKELVFSGNRATLRDKASGSHMEIWGWAETPVEWKEAPLAFADGRSPKYLRKILLETQAANPGFVTLLCPLQKDAASPHVHFEFIEETVRITVEWPKRIDTIIWDKAGAPELMISNRGEE